MMSTSAKAQDRPTDVAAFFTRARARASLATAAHLLLLREDDVLVVLDLAGRVLRELPGVRRAPLADALGALVTAALVSGGVRMFGDGALSLDDPATGAVAWTRPIPARRSGSRRRGS